MQRTNGRSLLAPHPCKSRKRSSTATGELNIDRSDEIIGASLVCIDGAPVRKREATLA